LAGVNIALLVLFVLIQVADVVTTRIGLKRGDDEANLLPAFMFSTFGFWPSVIGIKVIGLALAILATVFVAKAWIFTGGLCLIGLAVLWNNWRVLKT
jgi:hypothetical protein